MSTLNRLPSATQSKLRSTQILTSLPQLVSELIQNSLDAGACQIDVGVDCEDWSCWVRDDGTGMSRSDLTAFESAGRYGASVTVLFTLYTGLPVSAIGTSKAYSAESLGEVSTFGFRGEGTLLQLVLAFGLTCCQSARLCCRLVMPRDLLSHSSLS